MPPPITYTGVEDAAKVEGVLFAGKKFFLTARVPSRSRYVKEVESNGGTVVKLEKQATFIIADHLRQDAPPGSLSYTFIEQAIKDGHLPPEENHLAGRPVGTPRPVGSVIPPRGVKVPFTAEDDRQLYTWVKDAEARGIAIKGNTIYQQLEALNPRHTYQSWRDRYLKQLAKKAPVPLPTPSTDGGTPTRTATAGPVSHTSTARFQGAASSRSAPATARRGDTARKVVRPEPDKPEVASEGPASAAVPTPLPQPTSSASRATATAPQPRSSDQTPARPAETTSNPANGPALAASADDRKTTTAEPGLEIEAQTADELGQDAAMRGFENEDIDEWLKAAEYIQDISVGQYHQSWVAMAKRCTDHTAEEFRAYYEHIVLPLYLEKEGANETPTELAMSGFKNSTTQGQPVFASSSRRSTAVGLPSAGAQGQSYVRSSPHAELFSHRATTPKTNPERSENHYQSESHEHMPIPKPQKRKSSEEKPAPNVAQKRIKVEPAEDTQVQAETLLPLQKQGPITISSDQTSEDDDGEENEEDQTDRGYYHDQKNLDVVDHDADTSDNDAAAQNQLRWEMQRQSQRSALTAENLAKSQAQQNPRRDERALDIAPDDENQDQTDFADYIGSLLQGPVAEGQVNKAELDALREKHLHVKALANDNETDEDDDDDDELNDQNVIMNNESSRSRTQVTIPNLDNSSPLRLDSPDSVASLDPDESPIQSPYQVRTQDIDPAMFERSSEPDVDNDDIELDLPEPEGGWDVLPSQESQAQHETTIAQTPDLSPPPRDKGKGRAVDFNTQNVFDLETQVPDLDVAAPSSQHLPTSASLDSQAMTGSQIQAFVEYHSSQGVPGDKVLHALFRTSFRPELAEVVLEATRKGEEVPEHIPGVWTDRDDRTLNISIDFE